MQAELHRENLLCYTKRNGPVAQWIEHQSSELSVGGSIPSRVTRRRHTTMHCMVVFS